MNSNDNMIKPNTVLQNYQEEIWKDMVYWISKYFPSITSIKLMGLSCIPILSTVLFGLFLGFNSVIYSILGICLVYYANLSGIVKLIKKNKIIVINECMDLTLCNICSMIIVNFLGIGFPISGLTLFLSTTYR